MYTNLVYLIGKFCGPLFRSKKSIIENLKKSNISTKQNYNQLASNVLGNYGRIFSEYPLLSGLSFVIIEFFPFLSDF